MSDLEILDVSDAKDESIEMIDITTKKKDTFMRVIIISLIILIVGTAFLYFFGYSFLKPFIKV